jgi:hypothetical protein
MLREWRARAEREAARRGLGSAAAGVAFDPLPLAFPPQASFLADPSRFREACTTRRAGKSTAFVLDMLRESAANPNASVVYLNTTRDRAQRTVWEELKNIAKREGLPYVPNESRLALHGHGNRWIYVSGAESKKHIDKWKGVQPKVAAVYVDEAQDWSDELLEYAIARVILPALADMGGRLSLGGTPGALPEGFYFEVTKNAAWSHHFWTLFDNPYVKSARELVDETCRLRGVDEGDPTIRREFFGQWVRDTNVLVFGALDDELNVYDELPDAAGWRHVAGADFGFVDSSALEVVSWAANAGSSSSMFVTLDEAFEGVGPTDTVARIDELLSPLHGKGLLHVVGDPGGGGKGIMADLWGRFGVEVEPAEKTEKVSAVRLLADAIRKRELLIPRDAIALRRDLRRVQWDPDARGVKLRGHTPDRVDALLYAFRKAFPLFRQQQEVVEPSYDEQLARRIEEKARREAEDAW